MRRVYRRAKARPMGADGPMDTIKRQKASDYSRSVFTATAALLMVFAMVDQDVVAGWTDEEREQAYEWAVRESLAAADASEERLPRPTHVMDAVLE